ncbi:MAG: cytochrome P450 [Granulosicoccus sp.]
MTTSTLYRPPAPTPSSALRSLVRVVRQGDGDLLSLVPREAYQKPSTWLGYSRRSILLINDPAICREVLNDKEGIFPKNDLMVGALEGLVGDSLFVSSGSTWRRQRQMIDPAFSQLRVDTAFQSMQAAVTDYEAHLDKLVESGESFSLDQAMSHLTADIICRAIFSKSLDTEIAREVFSDFLLFERSVASVDLKQLIIGKPWTEIAQPEPVVAACKRIRQHIGSLLDPRLARDAPEIDDIVAAVIKARDTSTGEAFTREELIDQIGVFFLAGHETTASVLTWVFYILSQQEPVAQRIADDVHAVAGGEPVMLEHIRQLPYIRNVFREVLRLYPPITFLPRVALKPTRIAGKRIKRGAMIMISPWTAHRNSLLWENAERFDPDRFDAASGREKDPGVHLSFGIGPRVCVGASFATTEAILIIARLARRYRFHTENSERVRPVARLTTRPAEEILVKVSHR